MNQTSNRCGRACISAKVAVGYEIVVGKCGELTFDLMKRAARCDVTIASAQILAADVLRAQSIMNTFPARHLD